MNRRSRFIRFAALLLLAAGFTPPGLQAQEFLDRLDRRLSSIVLNDHVRLRVSGSLELEGYALSQPSPGLLFTDSRALFNPRLSLFVDADAGRHLYLFAQGRADRGFDPADGGLRARLDEYAVRYTPWRQRDFHLQAGRFGTVVGNWVQRHGAWTNPFVNAPLPYENLTGIWDTAAVTSAGELFARAHVPPAPTVRAEQAEKGLRVPLIWGPAYDTGLAAAGRRGRFDFAFEWKGSSLSADPEVWGDYSGSLRDGALGGRIGFRPNASWTFGLSASEGPYLRRSAAVTLPGTNWRDHRELIVGHDIGFAWHRWQFWAEAYAARFQIPGVGRADTYAGYVEAKYRFGPRVYWAARVNGQSYAGFPDGLGGSVPWGRPTWRLDLAPGIRFTNHLQLKFQHSVQHESNASRRYSHTTATQLTVRF